MEEQYPKIAHKKKSSDLICENSSIPLYLGASALLVTVAASLFFYQQLRNMKREIGEVKQIKNQMSNISVRFDAIDSRFEELVDMLRQEPLIEDHTPMIIPDPTPAPVVPEPVVVKVTKKRTTDEILKLPSASTEVVESDYDEEMSDDDDVESLDPDEN